MASRSHLQHGMWSTLEHERFLEAVKRHPRGPWHHLAASVGTRSPRQVQTHAHKFFAKIRRRQRGLQRSCGVAKEHRIDEDVVALLAQVIDVGSEPSDADLQQDDDQENRPDQSTPRRRRFRLSGGDQQQKKTAHASAIKQEPDNEDDDAGHHDTGQLLGSLPSIDEALDFFIGMLEVETGSRDRDNYVHV